ncbi:DUF1289 domain-containing protein [Dechloromonas sp. TW-R-39-2]|uniref:DUF1289 domain-containing protein n=1 Tax=Dechloromonas sp. TW-R-39-2 TaxID=2654218 RepID=UPI00193DEAFA|nr:DUF1289 domain-containing protein [Dechloromonas sp. TW-R-39-2]QRM18283.1 DUF1289 domain-containing protein [Dechloromonas sp. TW-R-39-2]
MLKSPCINVCRMDARSGLCTGCFRTIEEITVWARTDDHERRNILNRIATRRSASSAADTAPQRQNTN